MTTVSCPKCGTENSADTMNCKTCRINLKFGMEHIDEMPFAQEQKARRIYEVKQQGIHQNLVNCVTNAVKMFESLPEEIKTAELALDKAEEEFEDGAFVPFWDVVERAVTHLARFDQVINQILSQSCSYKLMLKDYDSPPPVFSLNIDKLPDASSTADKLQRIVRRAQKNFHFTTIYEQRKTNQILVQGFQSLGQALSDMTYRIESSIDALSEFFSNSMSDLVRSNRENALEIKDQLKTDSEARKNHEKKERDMLDNIQRRRKPFP